MTLGQKTVALFLVLSLMFSVGSSLALRFAVLPTFEEFEYGRSNGAASLVEDALNDRFKTLELLAKEYAIWDQTYEYVQGLRPDFADQDLDPQHWSIVDVDVFLIFDASGTPLHRFFSVRNGTGGSAQDETRGRPSAAEHPVFEQPQPGDSIHGYLNTDAGPLQVVSSAIMTSANTGPPMGTVIVGRFIKQNDIAELARRTNTGIHFHQIEDLDGEVAPPSGVKELLSDGAMAGYEVKDQTVSSFRIVKDVLGVPMAALEIETPKRVTNIGVATVRTASLFLCAASFLFLLAAWLFTRQLIVSPIRQLTNHMLAIRRTGELRAIPPSARSDEVGMLANEFGTLTSELLASQQRSVGMQHEAEEARDAALHMSQAKSEFLATMSHEIRTPMNGVLGMTELLLSSGLDRRQKHLANAAYRSAEGLLTIINDILDFSKIEADKLELENQAFDLLEVCEDALEVVSDEAHRKGLEIVWDLQPDTPRLIGDPTRLRQVLVNLLANAAKFTDNGEIRLSQRLRIDEQGRAKASFKVVDTGIGIEAEDIEKVFDAFAQADNSTSRSFGGTGLGLAICSRLVALMGGELAAQSTKNQGSTFSFDIPLALDTAQTSECALEELRGLMALVVDDHSDNRRILQNQLSGWGMRSDSTDTGESALHLLEQAAAEGHPYRIALLDWHMPQMNGIQLARKIKENPRIPDLPILVLSSTFDASGNQLHKSIVDRFLTKPVRRRDLESALRAVLGKRDASSDEGARTTSLAGHVLLAEDNRVNQEVAAAVLEAAGCQVTVAENGLEAVEAVKHGDFDLILMDCHMPEMDGFEATIRIRQWETEQGHASIPIIALTADVRRGIEEQCTQAGMNGYLSKPFNQASLTEALKDQLSPRPKSTNSQPHPITTQSFEHFDRSALEQLMDLSSATGKNILEKTLRLFESDAPGLIADMQLSFSESRYSDCAQAAHSLKSASANIGATRLSALCAELEVAMRQECTDNTEQKLHALRHAYTDLKLELEQLLATPDRPARPATTHVSDKQRILVADDDPAVRLMLVEALTAEGYAVEACKNGSEAFRSAKRSTPDLILLDALMPEMSGFDVCERINEDPALSHVPIMMLTGLDDTAAIHRAFAVGASAFSHKPIRLPLLLENLRFLMRAHSDAAELHQTKAQLEAAQRLARIGYWQCSLTSNDFHCSDQLEAVLGFEAGAIGNSQDRFLQLVREEDRKSVALTLTAASLQDGGHTTEYRIATESGHELLVRQETEIRSDANGSTTIFAAVQDISAQRAAEDKIRKLAFYDPLTALASRSYFTQKLDETIRSSARSKGSFSVFVMDLDGFKEINDALGHDIGDHLLKVVADRLRMVFRDSDLIGRLGGDEFCALIVESDDSLQVAQIAERCLETIEQPVDLGQKTVRPRISIGIAQYPDDGRDDHALLKAADSAMYSAKRQGKHRFEYYDASMTAKVEDRLNLVGELKNAFLREQFFLHYQPLVALSTGRVTALEALVRWQHPERGLVPPGEFIDELERTGMIAELGRWVLRTACEQARKWRSTFGPIDISVNISPSHLQESDAVQSLIDIVAETGMPADSVILEVTESTFQRGDAVTRNVARLREKGFKIAIDDFGTGLSSFERLQDLPVDQLKIDRAFVRDVEARPKDAIMLGGIANVARALGLSVIGEGVEELPQLKILESLGCDQIQGFYLSRAVPVEKVPSLLRTNFLDQAQVASYQGAEA